MEDLAAIERAFRCPVVNRYGSRELLFVAQTCPDNSALFHVNSERAILRVVPDGTTASPGQSGRIVITDLGNWVMPFINYDHGDRGVAGPPCPCGRGFPTLINLEGRLVELIRTPAGKTMSSTSLGQFLKEVPHAREGIWEYQAIRTAPDVVVLRVVPTPRFTPELAGRLERGLEHFLGRGMCVRVEAIERIAAEPSGKRLVIKSHLRGP